MGLIRRVVRSSAAVLLAMLWCAGCTKNTEPPLDLQMDAGLNRDEGGLDAGTVQDGASAVPDEQRYPLEGPFAEALAPCAAMATDARFPAPTSVDEAVARIDALPKPTSLACFIASLPGPLSVVPSQSLLSLQPAAGRRSPRVFLVMESLILSIVLDGDGRQLLEFGEFVDERRTIKAEIEFPVTATLDPAAPYTRIQMDGRGTQCGVCHGQEIASGEIPEAFVSIALRPLPETLVPLSELEEAFLRCDASAEPFRCELLTALFAARPITQGSFPESLPLFR